jgi:uncharacterized protein (TIGR01777 family)
MDASRIVIAGGTGLIGSLLKDHFEKQGREVIVLSRTAGKGQVEWDGKGVGNWTSALEGADAVINVTGKSVGSRWTKRAKKVVVDSRVDPTKAIGEGVLACKTPPKVWINASAIGIYGDTGSREVSEATRPGNDFLAQLCVQWEDACLSVHTPETRKVCLRMGVLIDDQSEFLKYTSLVAKIGLGAALGSGKQYVSWIHSDDLVKMYEWCLYEQISGAVNCCSPRPVTNAEYMAALRTVYGRPPVPNAPAFIVKAVSTLMGKEPSILFAGQRAVPEIAQARGFRFRYEDVLPALDDCLNTLPRAWKTA